jgi:hypothetical protein
LDNSSALKVDKKKASYVIRGSILKKLIVIKLKFKKRKVVLGGKP